jgi:hypothetical protein
MTISQIKELLTAEMENKKPYSANFATKCDMCHGVIEKNDWFIFMGEKQKVCGNCQAEINEYLEEV